MELARREFGKIPPENSENLQNLLRMVVDHSGKGFAPNKAGLRKNLVVVMVNSEKLLVMFFLSRYICCTKRRMTRVPALSILLPRVSCKLRKVRVTGGTYALRT